MTLCTRCDDTGLIELVGGLHRTVGARTRHGLIDTPAIEATPDRPIYKPCPCRHRAPAQVIPIARRYGADDD